MNPVRGARRQVSRREGAILLVAVMLATVVAVGTGSAQASTNTGTSPSAMVEPAVAPYPGGFVPIAPSRALDTRNSPPCVGVAPRDLVIANTFNIPADASAVALNVTVVNPSGEGYATVWPAGDPQPLVSNLNFVPGETVPNMVIVELGVGGAISIATSTGCPNVIVDIAGSFAAVPGGGAPGAPTAVDGSPGHQEVLLNWTAPSNDGGSALTGYTVTPSQGGTPQTPQVFASTATTQTITGLTDGLPYSFTVAATNAIGTGPDSSVSIAYTPTSSCTQVPPTPLNGTPLTMVVTNTTALPDDQIFVTLTGGVANGYSSWGADPYNIVNNSIPLSCLARDPSDTSGHSHVYSLGEGVSAGLLWISQGTPIPVGADGLPVVQPSFDTSLYRFANVEFAYPGQGDMTNVDQFSFPVDLDVWSAPVNVNAAPSQSSHFRGTTCEIVDALKATVAAQGSNADWGQIEVLDTNSNFVRVVAPKQRARQLDVNGTTPNPFRQGWPSMLPYVQSLANQSITVEGLFTPGASSPYFGDTGWYSYTGTFDANGDMTMNGNIQYAVATGVSGPGGVAGSSVSVLAASQDVNGSGTPVGNDGLATGIYDQNSQYAVDGVNRNGWTAGSPDPAAPNDVYNSIYRDLITAYTYGYWGGKYGSNSAGFWQTFTAPQAPSGGQPGFASARTAPDAFMAFNLFSQVMFQYSDNYNIPYGEDYGSGAPSRPSPLLTVPLGGRWKMTIKGDGPTGCLASN